VNQGNQNRAKAPAFLAAACVGFLASAPALAADGDEDLAVDEQQIVVEGKFFLHPLGERRGTREEPDASDGKEGRSLRTVMISLFHIALMAV